MLSGKDFKPELEPGLIYNSVDRDLSLMRGFINVIKKETGNYHDGQ